MIKRIISISSKPNIITPRLQNERINNLKKDNSKPKIELPKDKSTNFGRSSFNLHNQTLDSQLQHSKDNIPKSEPPTFVLHPEPENGITIAFSFSDGKRLKRKFLITAYGEELFFYIKSLNYFQDDDKFELIQTIGPPIERTKTLEDQNINCNTMIIVVCDK